MNNNSPYSYVFGNNKEKIKYISFYIIVLFAGIASSILAIFLKEIAEYYDKKMEEIILLAIIICTIIVINAGLVFIRNIVPHKFVVNRIKEKKKKIVSSVLDNDNEKVRTQEASDILIRVNEDMEIVERFIGETSLECITLIASSIVAFVLLLYLFLPVTIVAFISTPVFLLVISKVSDKIGGNAKEIQERTSQLNEQLLKSIEGNLEIQVFSKEKQFSEKFNKILVALKSENITLKRNRLNMLTIGKTGNLIPIIIVVFMGLYYVKQGIYTLGSWLAMFYLMEFSNSIFNALPELLSKYKEASVSVMRLKELELHFAEKNARYIYKYEKDILNIKNLSFSYEKNKMVLQNINLNIKQGEKIVIVGKSGCGKSTLINILCGFLPCKKGEIGIWNHEQPTDIFVYADQESNLFPGSIEENIVLRYERENDIKEVFQEIIKMVKLNGWIKIIKDEEKYDVGKNSKALSGGQRQKVGLARALIKANYTDKAILILDEATSYIDIETEKEIIKNIFAIDNLTCIFVAHRIVAYEGAERILYMENGSIVESGTHTELIEKKGKYYKMISHSI